MPVEMRELVSITVLQCES